MAPKKYTQEEVEDLLDSQDPLPEANGLMNRVRDARDHLMPFLTYRKDEVPEPLRPAIEEATEVLNDTYTTFTIYFTVIYQGLDRKLLKTTSSEKP